MKTANKRSVMVLRLLVLGLIGVSVYAIQSFSEAGFQYQAVNKMIGEQPVIAAEQRLGETKIVIPTYELFHEDHIWALTSRERPLKDEKGFTLIDIPVAHGDADLPMKIADTITDELQHLVNTAAADGEPLMVSSAHRTFAEQRATHDAFVAKNGATLAAVYVLPVGASEHHTGLAIDFSSVSDECAADSNSCSLSQSGAAWLAENAARFGFIQRYPEGKQDITGVGYEPWHFRYVGRPLAKAIAGSGLTFEETLQQIAPGYAPRAD